MKVNTFHFADTVTTELLKSPDQHHTMNNKKIYLLFFLLCGVTSTVFSQRKTLVFQSDFSLKDGAVSAMKGVALSVSDDLKIFDLTHEIPPYNIWEASYRLFQTVPYWPAGTVFISVVDPGVGSDRKSVVLKTKSGHYIVTPDNGTLTLVAEHLGIEAVREIDEVKNRRSNSEKSYTFHGRDVYAYTGARLAAGVIQFSEVGPERPREVVSISYQKPVFDKGIITGTVDILDIQYGNVWTNIDQGTFAKLNIKTGDILTVEIKNKNTVVFTGDVPFVNTFSGVDIGKNLAYLNSLLNFSLGVNQDNFSQKYQVFSGPTWVISIRKK